MNFEKNILESTDTFEQLLNTYSNMAKAIRLDVGQPDLTTDKFVQEKAIEKIKSGIVGYEAGMKDLKCSIINQFFPDCQVSEENILISHGAIGSLFSTLFSLINNGDEVLIPDPTWPTISRLVNFLGGQPIYYPFLNKNDISELEVNLTNRISSKTSILILVNPNNPNGLLINNARLLSNIGRIAEKHNLIVVNDGTYQELLYRNIVTIPNLLSIPTLKKRCVMIGSFSKTFNMTGWRLGYSVSDKSIINRISNVSALATGGSNTISQYAAIEAIKHFNNIRNQNINIYQERLDVCKKLLNGNGIEFINPDSAFYIFVNCNCDDQKMATILAKKGVTVVPGYLFGENGRGYIRIALTQPLKMLEKAIRIVVECIIKGDDKNA
ncbi:pyridoxal phosphate-dependent aminotransferase [Rummeliibacillus suwonensis]|uniref:pyridoxal phosphate-dependent aminotransferase n=1 Tax=Rummeliibacillus suwonensis TaxID=1306154 RepID=UPI001AAEB404|nr:pyridoxal phosphate-dependent aminotransferase [Rummeliibacillus suwonensis]MBO2535620.1 pyridoxal phosphate-dependent aminotransferase [Rummeliibacillus suwonensis]